MSVIRPNVALELLYEKGRINYDEMQSFKGSPPLVLNESLEAVEESDAFQSVLASLAEEVKVRAAELKRGEEELRADSRYAQAPEVTGVFVRQFWDAGDYLNEITRTDFTVPLPYLVENRDRLEGVRDFGDSDWLAFDLGLTTDHEGPFDVTEFEGSVSAWLRATEVSE